MSHHGHEDRERVIDDIRESQRNIVFPDTVRNGRSVDVFLWRGFPSPTVVQRIGAWLFGLTFIGFGLFLLEVIVRVGGWETRVMGSASLLVGVKICRNGFRQEIGWIGTWLYGIACMGVGFYFLEMVRIGMWWDMRIIASATLLLGGKICYDGFRQKTDSR